jgi:sigma-E factor negative regulatory protein RseC
VNIACRDRNDSDDGSVSVIGKVLALEDEYARVLVASGGCGRCHGPGGCGGRPFVRIFRPVARAFRIRNDCHAQPGDQVVVTMPARAMRDHAVRGYGLPLLGMLLGAVAGKMALGGNLGGEGGAMAGFLLAWLVSRAHANTHSGNPAEEPRIERIVSS